MHSVFLVKSGVTMSDEAWWDYESEDESLEDIEKKALKSLCGELMEEIFYESSFL
jgi:hypothetical protein